ncbi:hypothetical protein SAY86_022294 [Trapa natans]|uniref:Transmembrane protein n=1 Tax=Trapa natans TaxID=22666 RepID=A0AAN7LU42_TRANT|nr:hypothetical protein SAY86_022294 [Trapa natans]
MFRPSMIMLAARGWLRARRRSRRFLFLLLCSPVLIPLLFFAAPILCAAELCLRVCSGEPCKEVGGEGDRTRDDDGRLRACEQGFFYDGEERKRETETETEREREVGLLQRYLEDQLRLVSSVYECGDDFGCDNGEESGDFGCDNGEESGADTGAPGSTRSSLVG